ncbi:MAG: amidohydrolase family protein [Gammaproteobacteria bacterium]
MNQNLKLFDAHLHIIDNRFPLESNHGYLPDAFTCADYLNRMNGYTLCGGVVVSGSFQAFDQSYLIDSLNKLGSSFVGVTQLPETVTDEELLTLNDAGVRAVRFNLKRGGSERQKYLKSMAKRVYEIVGWHVELYVDSKELADLYRILVDLPAVSIDHLGLSKVGFSTLIKLAESGVHIKATGFGRVDFDIRSVISELYSANPKSLMFGTDLPSTRALRPFSDNDYALVVDILEPEQAINVLYKNAIDFYKPKEIG